jgi:hypothetical protein
MAFSASMLWRRIDTPGHDTCRLEGDKDGWALLGATIFSHQAGPVCLSYSMKCDLEWKTVSGQVRGVIGDRHIDYSILRQRETWTVNGDAVPGLDHLVDLDFSFTHATNLVQLRRVSISVNDPVQLPVAWFDLNAGRLTELQQTYKLRSHEEVFYEAPSVGYKGLLVLDPNGFVKSYPNLWLAEQALRTVS